MFMLFDYTSYLNEKSPENQVRILTAAKRLTYDLIIKALNTIREEFENMSISKPEEWDAQLFILNSIHNEYLGLSQLHSETYNKIKDKKE